MTLQARFTGALELLKTSGIGIDSTSMADALWLARVMPTIVGDGAGIPIGTHSPATPEAHAPEPSPLRPGYASNKGRASSRRPKPPPTTRVEDKTDTSGVFAIGSLSGAEPTLAATRVSIPAADALPGRADIERALKPFLARRPSRHEFMLDADATAEASAAASIDKRSLILVLRPKPERWFDVALLIEQDDAMRIFSDTLRELAALLARHGAFRRVRVWQWSATKNLVQIRSRAGLPSSIRSIAQSQGNQLVLLATHGASARWKQAPMRQFVQELARHSTLAIVHMLSPKAWPFTVLGAASELVRGKERGAVTGMLQHRDFVAGTFLDTQVVEAVPVFSLEAGAIAEWAKFVMSPRFLAHPAVSIQPEGHVSPFFSATTAGPSDSIPAQGDVRARLEEFRKIASPRAFQLLRLLAAAPASIAVMRLLLQTTPGGSSITPICELILSGFLYRETSAAALTQDVVFEFDPNIREWLTGTLTSSEWHDVDQALAEARSRIRRFVEERSGVHHANFEALALDPHGTDLLPSSAKAFVEVSRRLLGMRGSKRPQADPTPQPLGELHNFPEQVERLIPRSAVVASLIEKLTALERGDVLILQCAPGAGGQTLIAEVLRSTAVREQFPGGIWFGMPCVRARNAKRDALKLTFRFGREVLNGDVGLELRYVDPSETPDIGPLSAEESSGYLVSAGVPSSSMGRLNRVHRGIPTMILLVAVGVRAGMVRWPRITDERPYDDHDALAAAVMRALPVAERRTLIDAAAWWPGLERGDDALRKLAADLGWLIQDGTSQTMALSESARRLLRRLYPVDVVQAHYDAVQRIRAAGHSQRDTAFFDYVAAHLLDHVAKSGKTRAIQQVLFDRNLLEILLKRGRMPLSEDLRSFERRARPVALLRRRLLSKRSKAASSTDDLRAVWAPRSPWVKTPDLVTAKSLHIEGNGVRVGLLASGVDRHHPELQGADITGDIVDALGFGTSIASILAGSFIGMAPRVSLESFAVLDQSGNSSDSTLASIFAGLATLGVNDRPQILCIPLSSSLSQAEMSTNPLADLIEVGGVLVIAAAGNSAKNQASVPAIYPGVLSVGALTAKGSRAAFSSFGESQWNGQTRQIVDIWAPGVDMIVAIPEQSQTPEWRERSKSRVTQPYLYSTQTGTGCSCAYVAGIAALYAQSSGLRGRALRDLLLSTVTKEGMARYDHRAALAARSKNTAPRRARSRIQPKKKSANLK